MSCVISVVVPTFNAEETIGDLLLSLVEQTLNEKYEVLVVDDGSRDKTVSIVKDFTESYGKMGNRRVRLLSEQHKGPGHARNVGVKDAEGRIVVFIDSDCLPSDHSWLRNITGPFFANPDVGIVGGRIVVPADTLIQRFIRAEGGLGTPDYGGDDFHIEKRFIIFPTANLAVRKKFFEDMGGFDESLEIAEDLDFSIRAWKAKVPAVYSAKALVIHHHRNTLATLMKHGFSVGKRNLGFLHKYGFYNRFLKGTFYSAMFTLILPFLLLSLFLFPKIMIFLLISGYTALMLPFFTKCEQKWHVLVFPLFFILYVISLGIGVWYGIISEKL